MKPKILKLLAASAVLSLLAGCVVELAGCVVASVYPYYRPEDLLIDPGLAGRWAGVGTTKEFWHFTVAGEKSYRLGVVDALETNGFEAHLFRLRQYQFLDLRTTNRVEYQLPVHLISKVNHSDTNLSVQSLDYGWLTSVLETNPAVLSHILVPDPEAPDGTNDGMLFLTASTADLQAFLLKHATDTNAFTAGSAVKLQRISP
jgi:hypothetical protein